MRSFEYASPTTKEQAAALLGKSWEDAAILAGGTDLIAAMKDNVVYAKRVVDIKGIKDLHNLTATAAGLRIGALVTLEELQAHPRIGQEFVGIAQAAAGVTSPQIRNRGTVGGDLCQRPRCWYYRSGYGLLARDKNGKPLVPDGENRYHAILGNGGPAYFVNPSSLAPVLIALGAKVRLYSASGPREVPLEQFFVSPRNDNDRENVLKPNELLTEIVVPAGVRRTATYEVRQKESLDWPLAAASVSLEMIGDRVTKARVVLGHVAPVPWRAPEAEKELAGKTINADTALAAGKAAVGEARPLSQNAYKIQLARVAVKRALLKAALGGA